MTLVSNATIRRCAEAIRYSRRVTTSIQTHGQVSDDEVRTALRELHEVDDRYPWLSSDRSVAMVQTYLTEV